MRCEDATPLGERYLWLEGIVSPTSRALVAAGIPDVTSPNQRMCFVGFAYADVRLPRQFDVLFDLNASERCWTTPVRVMAATQQFGQPCQELPHGWKTICIIEFPGGVPEVVDAMPVVDAWHRSGIRLGMCDKNAYPEVVRMRQEAVEQPDAADGAGESERRR